MEGESAINRIVGIPEDLPEVKKDVENKMSDIFEHQEQRKGSKEFTPEQKEIIKETLSAVGVYLEETYGAPHLPLELKHIQLVDIQRIEAFDRDYIEKEKINASYDYKTQSMSILDNGKPISNLRLLHNTAHEAVHAHSFQSITAFVDKDNQENQTGSIRRLGFETREHKEKGPLTLEKIRGIRDEGVNFFTNINEAVTEEITLRFARQQMSKLPDFDNEIEKIDRDLESRYEEEKLKEPQKSIKVMDEITGRLFGDEKGMIVYKRRAAYPKYRDEMWTTLKIITEKNPDQFEDEEEVFQLFARHYFDGKLLDVARLIEKTFGKGSLRELAERSVEKKD